MPNITIENLNKEYVQQTGALQVLNNLDLEVQAGSIVAIEGSSGCGKSTLLNIIGLLDTPDAGQISYDSQTLAQMSAKEKEYFRSHHLGFIFQHYYLLPDFNLLENTMMPLLICRQSFSQAQKASMEALELVGLQERRHHYPSQISGGEMARACIARALVGEKSIILADEPSGNLDKENSDHLAKLLWKLQKKFNFTLILVTHEHELASKAPTRYQLKNGFLHKKI